MEMSKAYDPSKIEKEIYRRWTEAKAFHADPAARPGGAAGGKRYSIVIPPPNVTAALHLGQALNNTLQDILARWKRMAGHETLWMPGTDHAGIATQTVVEKRILAEEGKRRTDFSREDFVARVQSWKDEYEARILGQLKAMGCSCDWDRTRFTMDETCARAVREAFFKLFADGLIYRGKRLVNWDPATQTVLADDEVEHETVQGNFWYLRYPLERPVSVAGVPPAETDYAEPDVHKRLGRYLPHWTQEGATYAVTFRLADSVPAGVAEGWRRERDDILDRCQLQGREFTQIEQEELQKLFSEKIESYLDAGHGSCALKDKQAAEIVQNAMKHFDGDRYRLVAWAIMPNHVHVVIRPLGQNKLPDILHSWKSFTSHEVNNVLRRQGPLWMDEYYDHLIRDESDFRNQIKYVLANPEKAGLKEWTWVGFSEEEENTERGRDARDTVITHVTVATTRPETMLGDTAVAMNPADPRAKFLVGKMVRLPIVGRLIPIIADEHVVLPNPESEDAKSKFSTGFLKVTPAHDPDDYQIGQRHNLPMVNVLAPDGSISDKHGWTDWDQIKNPDVENLIGLDRFEAREAIVEWFRTEGLLEDVKPHSHEVGHSYRSHVPIEPYLSDQWFAAVKKPIKNCQLPIADCPLNSEGVPVIPGTDVPATSLAGLALLPLVQEKLEFVPERYANNYRSWLENLRDWPISRQLWWGHRIPVWSKPGRHENRCKHGTWSTVVDTDQEAITYACVKPGFDELEKAMESEGWGRDPDVLDTWFSSALWPISTMGWPEETELLKAFYPTDVLCTMRDIITLWVSRMVMFGQYFRGNVPFHDVYIHAMIQDGEGRKMSKSLGNGIDPLDIIASHGADAMRFTLAYMSTETQDVRMPVEEMVLPDGRKANTSPKFDLGRNFCNKLWNAARFALGNLAGAPPWSQAAAAIAPADRWIMSRLASTVRDVTTALNAYRFHEAAAVLYKYMWNDFCDWYLEMAKVRLSAGEVAPKAVLSHALDMLLRLLHPFAPFITEEIWGQLNAAVRHRGPADCEAEPLLVKAAWPVAQAEWIDSELEKRFEALQALISGIRDARTRHNVAPSRKLAVTVLAEGENRRLVESNAALVAALANVELAFAAAVESKGNDATVITGQVRALVHDIVDREAELAKLTKRRETLVKGVTSTEGKLNNPKFAEKAPANVAAAERHRLATMKEELAAVESALRQLG